MAVRNNLILWCNLTNLLNFNNDKLPICFETSLCVNLYPYKDCIILHFYE